MLPQVQFYQINTQEINLVYKLICELLYKFSVDNRTIYILGPDQDYIYKLDEYIINYTRTHFFAYQLITDGPRPPAKIILDYLTTDNNNNITNNFKIIKQDILFNLTASIPKSFIKYKNIIELVDINQQNRFIAREHYKYYKKYQCDTEFIEEVNSEQ